MAIELVQSATAYVTSGTSCTINVQNVTAGNTVVCAIMFRSPITNISDGWTLLDSAVEPISNGTTTQYIRFAYTKATASGTVSLTATQTTSNRMYIMASEYAGVDQVIQRDDMAASSTTNTVTQPKSKEAGEVLLFGFHVIITSTSHSMAATPANMVQMPTATAGERLSCYFDASEETAAHTFSMSATTAIPVQISAVQLVPPLAGYLVRDGESVYTVADGALVPVELTPGTREVTDKTLETSLWIGSGDPPRITKDAGNARAYVVPLVAGEEYTVTMLEASDRFRVATCATNPREMVAVEERSGIRLLALLNEHEAGQSVTFTAGGDEHYLVVHVTATQQEPACSIVYTISPLVNAFINHGAQSLPDGSLLLGLTSPEVLYWHDSDAGLPTLTAAINATPLPQYVISDSIDLTHESILGIQGVVVEEAGAPLYAVSFDDGAFMAYTDSWAATDTGMSGAMLAAITETQWTEAIAGISTIKLRALLQTPLDAVTRVYFDFNNPE